MPNEADPIVQYIIVRKSLNMSAGKIGAQCGHAVQHILMKYFKIQLIHTIYKNEANIDKIFTHEDDEHVKLISKWLEHESTKIVKKASEEEWQQLKNEFGKSCFVVRDAGHTEVEPGSETVMTFFPMLKSTCPEMIKKLSLL